MDGLPHYSTNVISTSAASYPSPPAVAPHQLQQQGSSLPQTLPPLQPNNLVMQQPNYGSYPNTPRTTPNTPVSAGAMASYPPPPPQNGGRGSNYPMMGNNPYQQPQQAYATSSAMLPQTTTAASHPQPIAPAPASGGRVPPMLRPMPASGVVQQQPGMNSPYAQSPLMPQQSMLPEGEQQPTHVVGSQGRRGILPSAPGKPAAPQAGSASGKPQVPQKDADGKFPCPHCTKTYLHAKHLKRHLLRHTGDRPYMCVLCRDTFSRSDILKRHFQKCSIRRGNPTGASHLSHPQAHVKKNAAAQQKAMGAEGDVNHINGMGNMPADGMVAHHPFGIISAPASDGMSTMTNDQSQLSRSSSMNRLEDASRDRRNMPGPVVGQGYNGDVSNNMSANINPQLANYGVPQNQNGIPMFGGSNSTDWSQMFQPGAQTTYVTPFTPNVRQTQTAIKQEPELDPTQVSGMAGNAPSSTDPTHAAISWGVPSTYPNAYEQLSTKIINFFYQAGIVMEPSTSGIVDRYFQPDNIKDFLKQYTHFHGHFTILHIPTFRALEAYVGLVAAMCCIGGCYSDRVSAANVRDIINSLKSALETSSRIFASLLDDTKSSATRDYGDFGSNKTDVEELQAVMLTQILLLWNGTPLQRETARRTFPLIATLARTTGLLRVCTTASLFSPIHQPNFSSQTFSVSNFDWMTWVEQEKRIRIMYLIFLCDASLGLYFNTGPQFDTLEIHLPLPSDDAAWDASTASECAEALGLYGLEAVKARNPDGTQRCNQPEMHLVLKALLDSSYQIQPGATNLYGKFILIHALLAMMRRVQLDGSGVLSKGSSTPVPQNAWFVGVQSRSGADNSGPGTPVDVVSGSLIDNRTAKMFWTALDKFKISWDNDMVTQFPPSAVTHPRRYGFSKDGIHFYWLATYLLKNTQLADLQMAPDQRFSHIIQLLKSVKNWVLTDGASRGEELGSVGEIDSSYGATYLTLDMAQLFKPLQKVVDSPTTIPVQTGSGNVGNVGIA